MQENGDQCCPLWFCWHQCLAYFWLHSQKQVWRRAFPIVITENRERNAAAERRAREQLHCFFELFIHTQTEAEWLDSNYWPVQSPSLFPSLFLSLTHTLTDTHALKDRHTHTPNAFHSGQFYEGMWKLIAYDLYSQQQDSYTAGRNWLWSQ